MFTRHETGSGQAYWRSSVLNDVGVGHAFTTRSWNVKNQTDVAAVIEQAELAETITNGVEVLNVTMSKQAHGGKVTRPDKPLAEADAHVTNRPNTYVAVRTADCVPILLTTPAGDAVAAIHAGWRGLGPAVQVIGHTVAAFRDLLGPQQDHPALIAAVGPCISAEHYEVGEEVASLFRERYPDALRNDLGEKPHLDTRAVAVAQLIETGLFADPDAIDVFPGCTYDDTADCFSYRREGPGVGHHAAIIAAKAV